MLGGLGLCRGVRSYVSFGQGWCGEGASLWATLSPAHMASLFTEEAGEVAVTFPTDSMGLTTTFLVVLSRVMGASATVASDCVLWECAHSGGVAHFVALCYVQASHDLCSSVPTQAQC